MNGLASSTSRAAMTNPDAVCSHCKQTVPLVFEGSDVNNSLVLRGHNQKDYVTKCPGSDSVPG